MKKKLSVFLLIISVALSSIFIPLKALAYSEQEIIDAIWADTWFEGYDNGKTSPGCSYIYYTLTSFVEKNYGNQSVCDWNDLYAIEVAYNKYFDDNCLTFRYDGNANQIITDDDGNEYKFAYSSRDNMWIEYNNRNEVVETFPAHSEEIDNRKDALQIEKHSLTTDSSETGTETTSEEMSNNATSEETIFTESKTQAYSVQTSIVTYTQVIAQEKVKNSNNNLRGIFIIMLSILAVIFAAIIIVILKIIKLKKGK